jgi:hypothetical protein
MEDKQMLPNEMKVIDIKVPFFSVFKIVLKVYLAIFACFGIVAVLIGLLFLLLAAFGVDTGGQRLYY